MRHWFLLRFWKQGENRFIFVHNSDQTNVQSVYCIYIWPPVITHTRMLRQCVRNKQLWTRCRCSFCACKHIRQAPWRTCDEWSQSQHNSKCVRIFSLFIRVSRQILIYIGGKTRESAREWEKKKHICSPPTPTCGDLDKQAHHDRDTLFILTALFRRQTKFLCTQFDDDCNLFDLWPSHNWFTWKIKPEARLFRQ